MSKKWEIMESWREIFEDLNDQEIIDLIIYENERFQEQINQYERPYLRLPIDDGYYEPDQRKEEPETDERGVVHINYEV